MTTVEDVLALPNPEFQPIEQPLWACIHWPQDPGRVLVIGLGPVPRSEAASLCAAGDAFPLDGGFALTRQGLRRRRGLDLEERPGDGQPGETARRLDLLLHAGYLGEDLRLRADLPGPPGPGGP